MPCQFQLFHCSNSPAAFQFTLHWIPFLENARGILLSGMQGKLLVVQIEGRKTLSAGQSYPMDK